MDKRTSDFIACVAIVGGAGLGLGVTSLFSQSPAPEAVEADARVRVLRRSVILEQGRRLNVSVEPRWVQEALIVEPNQLQLQAKLEALRQELERIDSQEIGAALEELRALGELESLESLKALQTLETLEALEALEALEGWEALETLEALQALEALEDLGFGQSLTIDLFRGDDDAQRRRRRRRRPRRVADVPTSDAAGN